jgi:hypothetical protein
MLVFTALACLLFCDMNEIQEHAEAVNTNKNFEFAIHLGDDRRANFAGLWNPVVPVGE